MERMSWGDFKEARERDDLRLIDVREQDEYDEVRVRGAELLPLSKIREEGARPEDDGRRLALICRSGGRSAMAAQIFENEGLFQDVINVEGGTTAAVEESEENVERGT